MTTELYLVWSFEHRAWWAPAERGYTCDIQQAGRYTQERAAEICEHANRYTKTPYEAAVPEALVPVLVAVALEARKWRVA